MRPLKLELQGFTAFRDHQVVSFEDLDLFVIAGPTGAGKTSLLDAMSYALFGEVPRMGKQGLSDLVSQGLTEARISLEFSSGGERYRVARRLRRKGPSSATFERADGGGWLNDVEGSGVTPVNRRIVDLLKLDFDAFTRAVVLPQGEFQRFLRGDVGERRDILIALLGLSQYLKMGARARARVSELSVSVDTTEKILSDQYADATPEAVKEAEHLQTQAAERAQQLGEALQTAVELDGKATGLRTSRESLSELTSALTETASALEGKAEGCKAAREDEDKLVGAAKQAEERCTDAHQELERAQGTLTNLVSRYGTLEEVVKAENALETHQQCSEDLEEKQGRLEGLSAQLCTLAERAGEAKTKVDELQAVQDELTTRAEEAREKAEDAKETARGLADRLDDAFEATRAIDGAAKEVERCQAAVSNAVETRRKARDKADAAEVSYHRLSEEQMATTLARELKVGDLCPVCHRVLESAPEIDEHIAEALGKAEQDRVLAEEKLDDAADAESKARAAQEGAEVVMRQAHDELNKALAGIESVELLQESVAAAQTEADARASHLTEINEQVESNRQALGGAQLDLATLTRSISDQAPIKDQLARECEQLQGRLATAAGILTARFGKMIPSDATEKLDQRRGELHAGQVAVESAQQALNNAQAERQQANEAVSDLQRRLSKLDSSIAALRAGCEATKKRMATELGKLDASNDGVVLPAPAGVREEDLRGLLVWCVNAQGAISTTDGRCRESLASVRGEMAALVSSQAIELVGEETELQAIRSADQGARERMIRCEEAVRQARERLEQRKELTASIAEKRQEIQVLRVLAGELQKDHFVQFIIQQTLDLLAVRASEELMRISAERYSLGSDNGEFFVVDHVNADEQRSVKTLSGGETFLASLSLALALSQHVGDLATEGLGAQLEAVFIDEGFGALDNDTLEDVIDALERLREGDLMVGVIRHVPNLAERIRVGVRIEKGQNQSEVVHAVD